MLVQEISKHIPARHHVHRMMLFLPGVNHRAHRIEQRVERMPLVRAHLVNKAVKAIHGQFVFPLVLNLKQVTDLGPRLLQLRRNDVHLLPSSTREKFVSISSSEKARGAIHYKFVRRLPLGTL